MNAKELEMTILVGQRELIALKEKALELATASPYVLGTFGNLLEVQTNIAKVERWLREAGEELNSK